ncbi:hypothetical protein AVEN_51088-1, partial [Araneus ventricosus]
MTRSTSERASSIHNFLPHHQEICSTCQFSLDILTSRFQATRGLSWDGPRNFGPRSDDEDDTCAGTPLLTSASHQRED